MDAVKFIKEKDRMCNNMIGCDGCPVRGMCNPASETIEAAVATVEKWSRENPLVTNGDKILEKIPSDRRATTTKMADSEAIEGMITAKDHIELRIEKDWWDAEYKEA